MHNTLRIHASNRWPQLEDTMHDETKRNTKQISWSWEYVIGMFFQSVREGLTSKAPQDLESIKSLYFILARNARFGKKMIPRTILTDAAMTIC